MEILIKKLGNKLVKCGYATEMKEVPYGLTKIKTFEVYVDGSAQAVDPYGSAPYSAAQLQALTVTDDLRELLTQLTEDELMHFNKIHIPIENMKLSSLLSAIDLVERTLTKRGVVLDK